MSGSRRQIAPESPDLVWFRGPDTVRFLNDLISREIATASPGRVLRSLLLGPQGKLDHILWVLRGDDEVGLLSDPGRGEELASTLGRYRIRVDVEIHGEQRSMWVVLGDRGPVEDGWLSREGGLVADISWSTLARSLVVGERPDLEMMSAEGYESARIEAGEPRFGIDVDEGSIPQQTGLVSVAVDFDKGCFLGQELVARINSRGGNVPQRLMRLEFEDASPEPGATVMADGREVGKVTSAAGFVALGMIRREIGEGNSVEAGGRTAVVKVLSR